MKFRILKIRYRTKWIIRKFTIKKILIILLLSIAVTQLFLGGYIYAKAKVAQYLISDSWNKTLQSQHQIKPWAWADTWPVAKLSMIKYNIELYVLAGDNGRTLAFGPGHRFGTVLPGKTGLSIISGHRDTHFNFLNDVQINDMIQIEDDSGGISNYQISKTKVVSIDDAILYNLEQSQLVLVTCYPFDSIKPRTKLRYLVIADKIAQRRL